MPPESCSDFVADMAGAQLDVLGIADPEVDVADIQVARNQDAKMVIRHKAARRIAGEYLDESQAYLTGSEIVRRRRQCVVRYGSGHWKLA